MHRKKVTKSDLKDIHFVCYEIIKSDYSKDIIPSDQIKLLKKLKYHVVSNKVYTDLSEDSLKEILVKEKGFRLRDRWNCY